jgi:hypothetical protein
MEDGLTFPYHQLAFEQWGDGVWIVGTRIEVGVQACGVAVVKCAAPHLGSDDERLEREAM